MNFGGRYETSHNFYRNYNMYTTIRYISPEEDQVWTEIAEHVTD